MGKHNKVNNVNSMDRGLYIITTIIVGLFIASFLIPNTNIRQPNPTIFNIADMQRTTFYKLIQFYYNSGQWDKIEDTINKFENSKGDLLRKVKLDSEKPIPNAMLSSGEIKYIKPESLEETKISDTISSYKAVYSFEDNGFKRLGLQLHAQKTENPDLFSSIIINDGKHEIKKNGVPLLESSFNSYDYLFTYEIPKDSKKLSVTFIDSPSIKSMYTYSYTPKISLTSTPSSDFNGKKINFVLNDDYNIEGFRTDNIYTINYAINAGICTEITLSSNPNIFLRRKSENNFSFPEYSSLEEKFSYPIRKDNFFIGELMPHKTVDYLGIKDYGTIVPNSDCIGID